MPQTIHVARHGIITTLVGTIALIATCSAAGQPDLDQGRIEPLLEELRRDEWKGAPSAAELGEAAPGTESLELTRDRGWLFAPRSYADFALEYEMWLAATGRHRVFFRTLAWPDESYELRIEARKGRPEGSLRGRRKGATDSEIPIEADRLAVALAGRAWHTLRIHAEGSRVDVTVNGTTLLRVDGLHILSGRIGFAGEGVTYRSAGVRTREQEPFRSAHLAALTEDLVLPTVVKEVKPIMPARGRSHRTSYTTLLEAVIDEAGDVIAARFVRRLKEDIGYNDEAMRVVKQWKFTPARLAGAPVPVLVMIEITFKWE